MKKIFSTVAMAVVAFASVVTMSSCQNDSPSSFNAAPQLSETKNVSAVKPEVAQTYSYQAAVNDEMFDYFDIVITRTAGKDVKTLAFANKTQFDNLSAKQTEMDSFKSAENVTIKATVTPKANWKQIFKDKGEKMPVMGVKVKCTFKGFNCDINPAPAHFSEMTDEAMKEMTNYLEAQLSVKK